MEKKWQKTEAVKLSLFVPSSVWFTLSEAAANTFTAGMSKELLPLVFLLSFHSRFFLSHSLPLWWSCHVLSKYTALRIMVLMQCLSDSSVLQCSGSLSCGPIWNGSLSLADLKNMNQKHKSPKLLIYGIYNCSARVCKKVTYNNLKALYEREL